MLKKDFQLRDNWNNNGKPKKSLKGILIYILCIFVISLLYLFLRPRTCCLTGTNRDVVRKNDLSQIKTAIEEYNDINGERPNIDAAKMGIAVSNISNELVEVGMNRVPSDPRSDNKNFGLGNIMVTGEYLYLITKKNGIADAGIILMASTEREGLSNRVVCKEGNGLEKGYITNDTDLDSIVTCETHTKGDSCSANTQSCSYTTQEELRYILFH